MAAAIILRLVVFEFATLPTGGTSFYYAEIAQQLLKGEGFTYHPYRQVSFPPETPKIYKNLEKSIDQILGMDGPDPPTDTRLLIRAPLYRYPPGYPIFLAACHFLFGPSPAPVTLIQILLNGLAAWMIYRLAYFYFENGKLAAFAGFLAAAWPFTLLNSLSYEPTPLLYATVIGSVVAVTRYLVQGESRYLVLAGLLSGVSAMLRTDSLFAAFGLTIALFLSKSLPLRAKIRAAGIFLLLTAAVMAPWIIRNAVTFHRFVPLSCGLGVNLMQGIGRYIPESGFPKDDRDSIIEDMGLEHYQSAMHTYDNCYPNGIEREERRVKKSIVFIREHPFKYLVSCVERAPDLFFVGSKNVGVRVGAGKTAWRNAAAVFFVWVEPVFFIIALIGLVRAWPLWAKTSPCILTIVLYAVGHLPLSVEPRYFKPAWPLLLIFCAAVFWKKQFRFGLDKPPEKNVA